jgi:hydroxymethylpyrimidine/phosphomethylpyrimidine kinase
VDEVAAFPGRLINLKEKIRSSAPPEFGASRHVAKVILTVMERDPEIRSAMAVRYSGEILAACRKSGLKGASFNRSDEPEEIKKKEGSSLEWGTRQVLRKKKTVPDFIWDEGEKGKEPVIRILGKNPEQVVNKVFNIYRALKS